MTETTSSFIDLLRRRPPESMAVVGPSTNWTTTELLARAGGAMEWLTQFGLPPGSSLPLLVPAGSDVLALTVAAAAVGTPVAPLNARAGAHDLAHLLNPVSTPIVVVDNARHADMVVRAGCTPVNLPHFAAVGADLPSPAPGTPAIVLHTSGTTGVPKRVVGHHRELVARVRLLAEMLQLGPTSVLTAGAPLHHIAGLGQLLVGLGSGAAVAPLPGSPGDHWHDLAELGVTHTILVPTMLHDLLKAGVLADAPLEVIQYGGASIARGLARRVVAALPRVRLIQLYGQTEGSPLTWLDDPDHRNGAGLDTVGLPVPGVDLRLEGEEILARGAHLFGAVDGAWLRTGDLGVFDGHGRLRVLGRAGDRIVRGGENIDPVEIEALIGTHPAVVEAAVIGIPDYRLGQRVRAFVVGEVDLDDLRKWIRAQTMGFKVPDEWVSVSALPRSSAGKVLRRSLGT